MMEVCVVRGTPPSTPLRRHVRRSQHDSPKVSSTRRRSLFREESDMSDISPLSPSSEDKTPKKKSPRKVDSTPLRGMNGLSALSLDSPVVRVHSEGVRMRGVTLLNDETVGSIPPNKFYGSHTEPRPPRTWIRKETSKAKTKLFLEDLPRDRKRARTSSGQKIQPTAKRLRRSIPGHSPRTPLAPIPMLGQSRSLPKSKKKLSPSQKTKDSKINKSFSVSISEHVNDVSTDFNVTKDFVTTEKDIEEIVGQEIIRRAKKRDSEKDKEKSSMIGNWEVSFTKESRLNECSTPTSDPSRKFFKNQVNTTPKMVRRASTALTPPWSSHKNGNALRRRTLCKPNYVFSPTKLSPFKSKSQTTPTRRSPRKSPKKEKVLAGLIKSISKDISEMMEDEPSGETKEEVTKLIQQLSENECTNDWASALPSPEEDEIIEEEEPKTPRKRFSTISPAKSPSKAYNGEINSEESKLYPIFRSSNKKSQIFNSATKSPSKSKKKVRKYFGFGEDQYQIDSGQKGLREVQCGYCGLFYSKGCPEDEIIHNKHHAHVSILSYSGWKKERVVRVRDNDKVICILNDDSKSWWNKAKEVVQLVDSYLGFPQVSIGTLRNPQIYLYVKDGREIIGCLVAEQITKGFKLLSLEQDVDLCSSESYEAKCGISRIWVSHNHRRSAIASFLLDSLRSNFAFGMILPKEYLAFTVPTDDGKKFISSYMGQKTGYLVYM